MSDRLQMRVEIPEPLLEALVEALTPRVLERLADLELTAHRSPWLAGAKAAADYLGLDSPQRVYKRLATIPHYREGGRLLFRRDELDDWLERCRER